MADPIYRNALRAARELWYDEQNLGELMEDLEPVSQLRQANEVSFVYEVPRALSTQGEAPSRSNRLS